jgi:branched-chain amino acid transport system ATP-binding protein
MTAPASGQGPVLVLENVAKRFGPIEVLAGINLQLNRGEKRALIGPNGAGKSTLFNLISGRFAPSSGVIRLGERRIDGMPAHQLNRMGLSRSFQITQVFGGMSLYENIYMAVMSRYGKRWSFLRTGRVWRDIAEQTRELIAYAQLTSLADRQASTLAYSEQRALEICMTVATGPDLILLDEPTSGMSRAEAANMVAFIGRMTQGRTLLMVEHDMDVVFGLADTISVLSQGQILATGTPAAIRDDTRVQDAYLGGNAH